MSCTTLKIAILGGTGRMGVPLAANFANSGLDVMLTSRDKSKAQQIVDQLKTGKGLYMQARAGGDIEVPPLRDPAAAKDWRLTAGNIDDAAAADVIVLGVRFDEQWQQLAQIKDKIVGKGKIFLDMTNPYIPRPDGGASGIPRNEMPPGGPAAVLYHQQKLNDPTAKWAGAFKHVLWANITPEGSAKKAQGVNGVEVFGDKEAVDVAKDIMAKSGWRAVVRGDLSVAPEHESMGPRAPSMGSPGFAKYMGSTADKLIAF